MLILLKHYARLYSLLNHLLELMTIISLVFCRKTFLQETAFTELIYNATINLKSFNEIIYPDI